jgi:hypothetical protein
MTKERNPMKTITSVTAAILAVSAQAVYAQVQTCRGPNTFISQNQTFSLTCNVTSTLGGAQMFILPEMWVPGNGCIITTNKPRVVMVGNNFGVNATFKNRCAGAQKKSEGGLAWQIIQTP